MTENHMNHRTILKWMAAGLAVMMLITTAGSAEKEKAKDAEGAVGTGQHRIARLRTVRVAGIVLKWLPMDKEANFCRAEKMIREAVDGGAKIAVTTECFLDGFMSNNRSIPLAMFRSLAERVPGGKYCQRLSDLADELDIYLAAGLTEIDGEQIYNTTVFLGPDGSLIGRHRKEKLGHGEDIRHMPGDRFTVLDTPYGRVGLRTCFERAFPKLIQQTCDAGADFVFLVAGGVYGPSNNRVVQARARENGRYMIFVHPNQFLVVAPDGSVVKDETVGGRGTEDPKQYSNLRSQLLTPYGFARGMVISPEQIGTKVDQNRVVFFDLPLSRKAASAVPDKKKAGHE